MNFIPYFQLGANPRPHAQLPEGHHGFSDFAHFSENYDIWLYRVGEIRRVNFCFSL